MDQQPTYKIIEEYTSGWEEKYSSLTRDQVKEKYDYLMSQGVNPERIKIVRIS